MTLTGSILLNRGPPLIKNGLHHRILRKKLGLGRSGNFLTFRFRPLHVIKHVPSAYAERPTIGAVQSWRSDRPCRWQPLACFALPQAASTVDSAASTELHMAIGVCDDEIFDAVALLDHLAWHGWRRRESLRGATPHASRMIWRPSACLWNDRSL